MAVDLAPDLDPPIAAAAQRLRLPGVAYAIVRDGEVTAAGAIGWADVAQRRPMTAATALPIASITKTFTALAVMRQVERGTLTLDAPVGDALRSFAVRTPAGTPPVTVRHLLTHTAGIGEISRWSDLWRPGFGTARAAGGARRPGPIARRYAPVLRTDRTVGRKWAYSNHGYMVLAALLEELTGTPFAAHLHDAVIAPLGLTRTVMAPDGDPDPPRATRYELTDDGPVALGPTGDDDPGAGGLASTADDLARYVAALLGGGRPVVDPATLAEMLRVHVPLAGVGGMGLGFQAVEDRGVPVRGHSGNTDGASSSLLLAPEHGVGVITLTNTYTLGMPGLSLDLLHRELGTAPGRRAPGPSRSAARALHGPYRPLPGLRTNLQTWVYLGGELEVGGDEAGLWLRGATPVGPFSRRLALEPVGDDGRLARFATQLEGVPITVAFVRDARGRVTAMHFGGLLGYFALRRRPRLSRLRTSVPAAAGLLAAALAAGLRRRARARRP